MRISEKICFEDFDKKFAKGHCAQSLAQMRAEVRAGRLALAAHAICLWLSGLRAKQGMLPLLAHEVRPCLIYG
ncbi:MAG: hypothetical protein WAL37_04045, partial [Xanthobacteraceae bacterium]